MDYHKLMDYHKETDCMDFCCLAIHHTWIILMKFFLCMMTSSIVMMVTFGKEKPYKSKLQVMSPQSLRVAYGTVQQYVV